MPDRDAQPSEPQQRSGDMRSMLSASVAPCIAHVAWVGMVVADSNRGLGAAVYVSMLIAFVGIFPLSVLIADRARQPRKEQRRHLGASLAIALALSVATLLPGMAALRASSDPQASAAVFMVFLIPVIWGVGLPWMLSEQRRTASPALVWRCWLFLVMLFLVQFSAGMVALAGWTFLGGAGLGTWLTWSVVCPVMAFAHGAVANTVAHAVRPRHDLTPQAVADLPEVFS